MLDLDEDGELFWIEILNERNDDVEGVKGRTLRLASSGNFFALSLSRPSRSPKEERRGQLERKRVVSTIGGRWASGQTRNLL